MFRFKSFLRTPSREMAQATDVLAQQLAQSLTLEERLTGNGGGSRGAANHLNAGYVYDEVMLGHKEEGHPEQVRAKGKGLCCLTRFLSLVRQPLRIVSIHKKLEADGLLAKMTRIPARKATEEELLSVHSKKHVDEMYSMATMTSPDLHALADGFNSMYVSRTCACVLSLCVSLTSFLACDACRTANKTATSTKNRSRAPCTALAERSRSSRPSPRERSTTASPTSALPATTPKRMRPWAFARTTMSLWPRRSLARTGVSESTSPLIVVRCWLTDPFLSMSRIAIIDWDVHWGNGTYHMFKDDPSILYVSTHRFNHGRFYPGDEDAGPTIVGEGEGTGFSVHVGWNQSSIGDGGYLSAFETVIMPICREVRMSITRPFLTAKKKKLKKNQKNRKPVQPRHGDCVRRFRCRSWRSPRLVRYYARWVCPHDPHADVAREWQGRHRP